MHKPSMFHWISLDECKYQCNPSLYQETEVSITPENSLMCLLSSFLQGSPFRGNYSSDFSPFTLVLPIPCRWSHTVCNFCVQLLLPIITSVSFIEVVAIFRSIFFFMTEWYSTVHTTACLPRLLLQDPWVFSSLYQLWIKWPWTALCKLSAGFIKLFFPS